MLVLFLFLYSFSIELGITYTNISKSFHPFRSNNLRYDKGTLACYWINDGVELQFILVELS